MLSFVYESKSRRASDFIPTSVRVAYSTATRVLEKQEKNVTPIPSSASIKLFPTLRVLATEDVLLEIASLTRFSGPREKALLFAFLIHLLLLLRLSAQGRARRLEPMRAEFRIQLISNFLPTVFRAVEVAITSLSTTIDVDVRVFIALVRFLAKNNTLSVQDVFGNDIAKIVEDKLSSFSVPISAFSQFASEFLPFAAIPPTKNRLGLLPFSNKIFDDELAPIHNLTDDEGAGARQADETEEDEGVDSDEESDTDEWDTSSEGDEESDADESGTSSEEDEESDTDEWDTSSEKDEEKMSAPKLLLDVPRTGYFDDGTLFNDTRHWHNHKRPLLPKHLGGEAPAANATGWQRKKKLRDDQRYMKTLHDQAATLTGASGAALHQIKILPVSAASTQPQSKVTPFALYDGSAHR